jgi:hypothetical protein
VVIKDFSNFETDIITKSRLFMQLIDKAKNTNIDDQLSKLKPEPQKEEI